MQLCTVLATEVLPLLVSALDETPEPEDVKAGWTGFAIFLGLAAAVVLLAFSLLRQLRKAEKARQAGAYGDAPDAPEADTPRPDGSGPGTP